MRSASQLPASPFIQYTAIKNAVNIVPELDQLIFNFDFVNTATLTCQRILSEAEGEERHLDINHTFDATTTTTPEIHAPHQSTGSLAAPLRSR